MRRVIALIFFAVLPVFAQEPTKGLPDSLSEAYEKALNEVRGGAPTRAEESFHRPLIEKLIEQCGEKNPAAAAQAQLLLEHAVDRSDSEWLARKLRTEPINSGAKVAIVRGWGRLQDTAVLDTMRMVFDGGERTVQLAVIDALGMIAHDKAVNILAEIISQRFPDAILRRAASALGRIGSDRAVYVLNSVRETTPEGVVRRALEWALVWASGEVTPETTSETIEDGRRLRLYYKGSLLYFFRPPKTAISPPSPWLLVCVHGDDLDAQTLFDRCAASARSLQLAVLVPVFDDLRFPEYGTFNLRGIRSDQRLLEMVEFVGKRANLKTRELYLFGFREGGDLVERMTLLYPKRVARSAFLPSSLLAADESVPFPAGFGRSVLVPQLEFRREEIIKTDFMVLVETAGGLLKPFREFYGSFVRFAEENGYTSRIRFQELDGRNLLLTPVWQRAAQYLFPSN